MLFWRFRENIFYLRLIQAIVIFGKERILQTEFNIEGLNNELISYNPLSVNLEANFSQLMPSMSQLNDETFLLVWYGHTEELEENYEIFAYTYNSEGDLLNSSIVNDHPNYKTYNYPNPRIAVFPDETFMIIYFGNATQIYMKYYDQCGYPLKWFELTSGYDPTNNGGPIIAVFPNSSFIVGTSCWGTNYRNGYIAYLNIENFELTNQGLFINQEENVWYLAGNIQSGSNSSSVMAYPLHNLGLNQDGIYGWLLPENKSFLISDFPQFNGQNQEHPSILSFSNGSFLVVWEGVTTNNEMWQVYAALFDDNANIQQFHNITNDPGFVSQNVYHPASVILPNDEYAITFLDQPNVYLKIYNSNAEQLSVLRVNGENSNICKQTYPMVYIFGPGIVVFWNELKSSTSQAEQIKAQRFSLNGEYLNWEGSIYTFPQIHSSILNWIIFSGIGALILVMISIAFCYKRRLYCFKQTDAEELFGDLDFGALPANDVLAMRRVMLDLVENENNIEEKKKAIYRNSLILDDPNVDESSINMSTDNLLQALNN